MIGAVTAASGITLGDTTAYYTGISPTTYATSAIPPVNDGNYAVTADMADGDNFLATTTDTSPWQL